MGYVMLDAKCEGEVTLNKISVKEDHKGNTFIFMLLKKFDASQFLM